MKVACRLLGAALLVAPVSVSAQTARGGSAASVGPPKFVMWTAAELKQRDQALPKNVGPDNSSRETLAQFPSQRFRLLYRDADGAPEVHENEVDVVIVQSGEGTLLVGGTMVGGRAGGGRSGAAAAGRGGQRGASGGRGGAGGGADDGVAGATLEGAQRYPLGPGDVAHIPAKVPHAFLVPKGKHLTYILVKFPPPVE
jgi:mannose-6-phosphate isomerase-like protein (cupin superfamily)